MDTNNYFKLLVHAAFVDGELKDEEATLLRSFAKRLKIKQADYERILGSRCPTISPSDLPKDRAQAKKLFQHMARIVVSDSILHPSEKKLMDKVGKKLGFSHDRVIQVIESEFPKQKQSKRNREQELVKRDSTKRDSGKGSAAADVGKSPDYEQDSFKPSQNQLVMLESLSQKLRILGFFMLLGTVAGLFLCFLVFSSFSRRASTAASLIAVCLFAMTFLSACLAWQHHNASKRFKEASISGAGADPIFSGLANLDLLYTFQLIMLALTVVMNVLPRLM